MGLLLLLVSSRVGAQAVTPAQTPGGPTTTLPLSYPRAAKFTTDEGTWISLDVAPDGQTIVFDLAGDLYTVPISGGKATRITNGPGFDAQPRFSPDGKLVLFHSDRSGSDNLYTVTVDGAHITALTSGTGKGYFSPIWTPDGQHIMAAGGPQDGVMDAASGLYLYDKAGYLEATLTGGSPTGGGIPSGGLFMGPAFGKEQRYLFYSVNRKADRMYDMQEFQWQIFRYDFQSGENRQIAKRPGGAFRPVVSPDGRWLVYATRRDASAALRLRNLVTEEEHWLIRDVQRDDMEGKGWARDLLPGAAFTPDSKALLIAFKGKIWRVEVPSGQATNIPFSADVDVPLGARVHFTYPINDSVVTVGYLGHPRLSPDNRRVVFTALDRLYVMELPTGTPRRLTTANIGEFEPAWSPDGEWIAYVTWDDLEGGAVYRVRADGQGIPERLTHALGRYSGVAWSPTGNRILAVRMKPFTAGTSPLQVDYMREGALVWFPAGGGDMTSIVPVPGPMSIPMDNSTISFLHGDSTRIYVGNKSIRWDGTDVQLYQRVKEQPIVLSPDGTGFFAYENFLGNINKLILARIPFTRDLELNLTAPYSPLVARQLNAPWTLVQDPAWSPDGTKVVWATGHVLFIYDVAQGDTLVADSLRKAAESGHGNGGPQDGAGSTGPALQRLEVRLEVPADRPAGIIALQHARIITMRGDTVLEHGDLVIARNRIVAIGPSGTVPIPAAAKRFDLRGTTIIPGLIDVHAHPRSKGGSDIHVVQPWDYAAPLAYGITTVRDPAGSWVDFSYADILATGTMLGPRLYSVGMAVQKKDGDFSTADKARESLNLYAEYFDTKTIKQYLVGDRRARQNFLIAAQALHLTPTLEGGLDFRKNITEAMDGYAGSEHDYPIMPLYRDIIEIVARSGITYTPTPLVSYGGPWGRNYFFEKYQAMHDDPKLRRFVPHAILDERFRRRDAWFADSEYTFRNVATQAAKIVQAGGHVALGGHGEFSGLGEHWSLWALQSGGMSPLEALRCATLFGAEEIGLSGDLGSLAVGKLADLVVLDKNPLDNIQNTLAIRYVVQNGRVYDGNTLDEVWPRLRKMRPIYGTDDSNINVATPPMIH